MCSVWGCQGIGSVLVKLLGFFLGVLTRYCDFLGFFILFFLERVEGWEMVLVKRLAGIRELVCNILSYCFLVALVYNIWSDNMF